LAYIFGKLYETAIIIFVFALLQVFGGGYHAKTAFKCLITMIVGAIGGNVLIMLFANLYKFNIMIVIVLTAYILISRPIINKRHPVRQKTLKRSAKIVKSMACAILFTSIFFALSDKSIEIAILMVSLSLYVTSSIFVKIQNAREK
jgi:accessory gene regulator protein AgrB